MGNTFVTPTEVARDASIVMDNLLVLGQVLEIVGHLLGELRLAIRLGIVLRPLSAQHLPPTVPEREGWVDREKLLAISGRSRKEQIRLAG